MEFKALGDCVKKNIGGGTPSKAVAGYWDGDILWASVGDLSIGGNLIKTTRNKVIRERWGSA